MDQLTGPWQQLLWCQQFFPNPHMYNNLPTEVELTQEDLASTVEGQHHLTTSQTPLALLGPLKTWSHLECWSPLKHWSSQLHCWGPLKYWRSHLQCWGPSKHWRATCNAGAPKGMGSPIFMWKNWSLSHITLYHLQNQLVIVLHLYISPSQLKLMWKNHDTAIAMYTVTLILLKTNLEDTLLPPAKKKSFTYSSLLSFSG